MAPCGGNGGQNYVEISVCKYVNQAAKRLLTIIAWEGCRLGSTDFSASADQRFASQGASICSLDLVVHDFLHRNELGGHSFV